MPPIGRVKDMIRAVRACKTAQDERDLVNKECAFIRTSFKDEDQDGRNNNVAKLLYIHMLGYPAHFGQMECLKLVASTRFADKRLGYLGAMLLLDENQDTHLLITNSLKNDMNHQVQYIVGLALCALGSICSEGMSRDCAAEVEKLLRSSNPYVVRKAALCAVRIVRKVPELMEMYVPVTRQILNEKNHGVLLTGVALVTELCKVNPDSLQHFRRFVPNLVRIAKNLVMAGYSPEHDVHGISDPFLQVGIIRLMRVLGKGDRECSEAMNDILAQIATNTDATKNVGHAILYETVLTIMDIESESGLRVLAVNILGRFLQNSDRNIRYVALNTLLKTVGVDNNAVQRHRNTVLECLKENDVTIRRRALELSFALVNANSIRLMMKELLEFLDVSEPEFKPYITSNILSVAQKYSPSKQWYIDTVITTLVKAGNYVREDLVNGIIATISAATELHGYCAQKLYTALLHDISQQPLAQTSLWTLGEFGDLLVNKQVEEEEPIEVTEDEILDVMEKVLQSPQSLQVTKEYAFTAVMKLSARFSRSVVRIKALVSKYSNHLDVELQQRATEYLAIFAKHDEMRMALLERMPTMNAVILEGDSSLTGSDAEPSQPKGAATTAQSQGSALLDLLGDTSTHQSSELHAIETAAPKSDGSAVGAPSGDPLLDLFGSSQPSTTVNQPQLNISVASHKQDASGGDGLMDLLGGDLQMTQPAAATSKIPNITAYEKGGLKVDFAFQCDPNNQSSFVINLTATNSTPSPMTDFLFQSAVPKTFTIQLETPSGNVVPPNNSGAVTQSLKVANPQKQPIRMRLRISYSLNGSVVQESGEVNNFPAQLLA